MLADPNRVRDVFLAAIELPTTQRPVYLAETCGGDADLRAEVERLLAAHADPDSIVEPAAPTPADATAAYVPGDSGTALLPGGTSATDEFESDAPRPKEIATENCGPDKTAGTFEQPDPDAITAAASGAPAPA